MSGAAEQIFVVRLFGPYADAAGGAQVEVRLSDPAPTAAALMAALGERSPALRPLLHAARLAMDGAYLRADARVSPGRELALIGLVGGG